MRTLVSINTLVWIIESKDHLQTTHQPTNQLVVFYMYIYANNGQHLCTYAPPKSADPHEYKICNTKWVVKCENRIFLNVGWVYDEINHLNLQTTHPPSLHHSQFWNRGSGSKLKTFHLWYPYNYSNHPLNDCYSCMGFWLDLWGIYVGCLIGCVEYRKNIRVDPQKPIKTKRVSDNLECNSDKDVECTILRFLRSHCK